MIGEGRGEVGALPVLVQKLLREKHPGRAIPLEKEIIRKPFPIGRGMECREWKRVLQLGGKYARGGAVLVIYDGDLPHFPPGSKDPFCAKTAARRMAETAREAGAGQTCSVAVVFACVEFETWIVAGLESLRGKEYPGGRIPAFLTFPAGDPESHGKRWLENNLPSYLPGRDQKALTELLDVATIRAKGLRSFARLEHALDELVSAMDQGPHVSTPC